MNIELSLPSEKATAELLDTLVVHRPANGRMMLSVQFLCRRKADSKVRQDARMSLPPLSWFDANQLQTFTKKLATVTQPERYQVDLPDAGLRLVGMPAGAVNRSSDGRMIRVEPLPTANRQFAPFSINGTQADIRTYARKLYNRLWEAFCRG